MRMVDSLLLSHSSYPLATESCCEISSLTGVYMFLMGLGDWASRRLRRDLVGLRRRKDSLRSLFINCY